MELTEQEKIRLWEDEELESYYQLSDVLLFLECTMNSLNKVKQLMNKRTSTDKSQQILDLQKKIENDANNLLNKIRNL